MICNTHSVDLTPQDIEVIEAALHTQEKILAVQSKASTDGAAAAKLGALKSVLRTLRRQTPAQKKTESWGGLGRVFFG